MITSPDGPACISVLSRDRPVKHGGGMHPGLQVRGESTSVLPGLLGIGGNLREQSPLNRPPDFVFKEFEMPPVVKVNIEGSLKTRASHGECNPTTLSTKRKSRKGQGNGPS